MVNQMDHQATFDFERNVSDALSNSQLRKNLRSAMDTLIEKRKAVFADSLEIEALRTQGAAIKRHALSLLPQLLEQLERNLIKNGIQVHWSETVDDANKTVLEVMRSHGATRLIKGKSMVSEEMHLNKYLEQNGIESIESDLGEFIIQLDDEPPSHIIVPAIHKNRDQIARTFHAKLHDTPYTEDVGELTAIARRELRRKFFEAEVGLSGVNFAVAETGTLCLVENEGNGRMCTTIPQVHIAVMGLEKVVAKLTDLPPLLRLLTGSATGQMITTYVNMISSVRKAGEKDGPREIHLIILNNGRSKILADPELRETLLCIRCGTCLNHCPVYTRLGGHAYGFVYPGPIGKILTPQMEGLKKTGVLASASSLCNACEAVCPVKIPITKLLRRLRRDRAKANTAGMGKDSEHFKQLTESLVWKGWKLMNSVPIANSLAARVGGLLGSRLPKIGPLKQWTRIRTVPRLARKTLHALVRQEGVDDE
jgi:L-lactate dehydrogenase complex protein LldF